MIDLNNQPSPPAGNPPQDTHSQPVPAEVIDRIMQNWGNELPVAFASRISHEELRTWLSCYLACLKNPHTCKDTHPLTMSMLSDFQSRGGQLNDFFSGMLHLPDALHDCEQNGSLTDLENLRKLVLADFSFQMVNFFRDAMERQNKEIRNWERNCSFREAG